MSLAHNTWRPSAKIDILKKRAAILKSLRDFFYERSVIEVETPLLCQAGTTDVYLDSMVVTVDNQTRYLQTSPEFAMKRLLAAGIGDCYQLCKAFRRDEVGHNHNPEFTMLEWYRIHFDHHDLMNEMDDLLQYVLKCSSAKRISYESLFLEHVGINPHIASIEDLKDIANIHAPAITNTLNSTTDTKDDWLMLLLSECIEPKLGFDRPCFIYDYPASQAALAKVRDNRFAERFEVYVKGIELANGFHELQEAHDQLKRFENDNVIRARLNKTPVAIDYRLIDALTHGLPPCAGVALGIDRLVMIALEQDSLKHVISFDFNSV